MTDSESCTELVRDLRVSTILETTVIVFKKELLRSARGDF